MTNNISKEKLRARVVEWYYKVDGILDLEDLDPFHNKKIVKEEAEKLMSELFPPESHREEKKELCGKIVSSGTRKIDGHACFNEKGKCPIHEDHRERKLPEKLEIPDKKFVVFGGEVMLAEKFNELIDFLTTEEKENYERYSHIHCWNQDQPSACSIPLEKHTQCCLCDTPKPEEKPKNIIKAIDAELSPPLKDWEVEFDKRFPKLYEPEGNVKYVENLTAVTMEIKAFLSSTVREAEEKLMVNAIEFSKQGWIDQGRIEEKSRLLKIVEDLRRVNINSYSYNVAIDLFIQALHNQ